MGERYRGVDGHVGYLLRQASQALRGAMDGALRPHGVTASQYAVLSVLGRDPDLSGADLARACNTTPQAMNGVLATLERGGLIARRAHPTHGLGDAQVATVKAWLVESAARLERAPSRAG